MSEYLIQEAAIMIIILNIARWIVAIPAYVLSYLIAYNLIPWLLTPFIDYEAYGILIIPGHHGASNAFGLLILSFTIPSRRLRAPVVIAVTSAVIVIVAFLTGRLCEEVTPRLMLVIALSTLGHVIGAIIALVVAREEGMLSPTDDIL